MNKDRDEVWDEWKKLVNITPARLKTWLESDESKSVGWSDDGGESVGHKSGRRIIEIKRKRKTQLTDEDWQHMAKVVGYIKRHLAQGGPEKFPETSRWRYSLMNWGHDPLKGHKIRSAASKGKGASTPKLGKPKTPRGVHAASGKD